ncbi:hypothetical protein chiPu_0017221 [Chiloscyllium punctatum]|uniref:Helicase-like transcription factor n=1 Tax=Chiloscyllium punctatum TaxID=137246 RepID=A0A401T7W6_CHIPU|nr:hypothetical protein [Chiloscyllium punctatum]
MAVWAPAHLATDEGRFDFCAEDYLQSMLFWRNWSSSQYLGGRSASQFSDGSFLFAPDPEETLSQMINRTLTDDTASPDEDLDSVLFGNLRGNVVGMRYYTGVVSNNEMVALQREPNNPYDRNAVQVNNVNGIQVGHIKRELAAPLAFILDNRLARVEGVVPYGANNVFTMPVQLSFWGREENRDTVLERLKRHGFKLAPPTKGSLLGGGIAEAWSGMGSARPGPSYKAPVHTAVQMTVEQLKNEFDKIFEDLKEHDKTREMEPAKAVCTPLLPHQKQALAWMVLRENNADLPPFWEQRNGLYYNLLTNFAEKERPENVRGGILADDMGLGKTLSTIAVILTNFHQGKPLPTEKFTPGPVMEEEPSGFADALGKSSARKANEELSNTFKMQTGADNRNKTTVIDTTGSITSSGSKPHSSSYPKSLVVLYKLIAVGTTESKSQSSCGLMEDIDFAAALGGASCSTLKNIKKGCPSSQPSPNTAANAKARSTLIVCPLSVLSNWIDQFERHLCPDVKLNMYLYYGSERNKTASFLAEQDIVLTTYNTLTVDYGSGSASPLHKVKWLRVVLDEGHTIRNPNAQQTKAALTLTAERRWVLTGTPIQNSLKDLWSILSFLKLKPFTDRQWWHRTIQRPVTMGDQHGLKRLQALIKNITLRRTKASKVNGKPVIELPERTVFVQHITLTDEEKQIYESVKNEGRAIIGRYFSEGSVFTHYADVLAILVWLRQLCCHPRLFANSSAVMGSSGISVEELAPQYKYSSCGIKHSWNSLLKPPGNCARVYHAELDLPIPRDRFNIRQEGFAFTRLDGSMPQKRRINAIESFQSSEPGSPTVMLLSLKAGGVGLNLTAASRVFLMDPAWNPAAEDQCFDRCHRLGQTRDVVITKFIVKNSVEENMIKIQNKKRELAAGAFGTKRQREIKQSRIEEIKILIDV